jgi:hypothetical protein
MDAQNDPRSLVALNGQIVAELQTLADSWKITAAELTQATQEPPKSKRKGRRKSKS